MYRTKGVVERLDNSHLPLGIVEESPYTSSVVHCAPGDTFVLYTDGLTEAMDHKGRELGITGFERIVESNAGTTLRRMFDAIMAGVRAHSGRTPQGDDQTLLLARLR